MPKEGSAQSILHATAVAWESKGILILGASGSGKSTLALQIIALGAHLVADDRVLLLPDADDSLTMTSPDSIAGRIEARQFGILKTPHRAATAIAAVDLDEVETDRLPQPRTRTIMGVRLPLFRKVESPAFPAMLLLYMQSAGSTP